jgi:hypothetical protein
MGPVGTLEMVRVLSSSRKKNVTVLSNRKGENTMNHNHFVFELRNQGIQLSISQ